MAFLEAVALPAPEEERFSKTIDAVVIWARKADLSNEAAARRAVAILCEGARSLNIDTVADVRALSFDQALEKAGILLRGAKEILAGYGIILDAFLNSVDTKLLSEKEEEVVVAVTFEVLGHKHKVEGEMPTSGERWVPSGIKQAESFLPPLKAMMEGEPLQSKAGQTR